jgi:hypothetical protein
MLGLQLVDERSGRSRLFATVVSRKHLAELSALQFIMTLSNSAVHQLSPPRTLVMLTKFTPWPSQLLRHSSHHTISTSSFRSVPTLSDASLTTFKDHAFNPAVPSVLPRGSFLSIPAIQKWFLESTEHGARCRLNTVYLKKWGSAVVPLEITNEDGKFAQIHQPLQFLLEYV